MKAVFDVRVNTHYDDNMGTRYHFPNKNLRAAEQCLGDWIIYRETKRGGGRSAFVAVARLRAIEPDPNDVKSSYAMMEDFLEFDVVVPLDRNGIPYENILIDVDLAMRGITLHGNPIRTITDLEFMSILESGLPGGIIDGGILYEPRQHEATNARNAREIRQFLINRAIRDAAFRRKVISAYEGHCAMTGIRLEDSRGYFEAQAAHVRPVADGGPDIVQNGIALCATMHWLFDRHVVSLTDNFEILGYDRLPRELRQLLVPPGEQVRLPRNLDDFPRLEFVQRHRERFNQGLV